MNVKLGDVAIVINGRWPNIGRLVHVARATADRDYSHMGYGILPSWSVESLGGDFDTDAGPARRGFIPDIALRRLDLKPAQARAIRAAKVDADLNAALAEFAVVLADIIVEPQKAPVLMRERQRSTIPNRETISNCGERK